MYGMVRSFSGKRVVVRQLRPNRQKITLYGCDVLCYVHCRYGQAQAPGPWQPQPGYQAPPPVTPKVAASSDTVRLFMCFTKSLKVVRLV